jgi:hypothetical protein
MNNDFSTGFTRVLRGLVARAVIDNEHVIELLARSTNNVTDMFFFAIRRDDRGSL